MITILRLTPGEDETRVFTYSSDGVPVDVTGFTATATFTVRDEEIVLTEDDGIEVGDEDGTFTVSLTDTETAALGAAGHFGKMTLFIGPTDTRLVRAALVMI